MRLVDRNNPKKLYLQLADTLAEAIGRAEWQVGDKLPVERELCLQHDVSLAVVRAAMQELAKAGLIEKKPGKGTFVRRKAKSNEIALATTLTEQFLDFGIEWKTDVIQKMTCVPPSDVAGLFNQESHPEVFKVVRLRSIEDAPVVLDTSYVSNDLCPGLAFEDLRRSSMFDLLSGRFGVPVYRVADSVEVTTLDEREARLLKCKSGRHALLLDRIIYTINDRVAAFCRAIAVSEEHRITFQAHRSL